MFKSLFMLFTPNQEEDNLNINFKYILFRQDMPLENNPAAKDFPERATVLTYSCKTVNDLWSTYQNISQYINLLKQPKGLFDVKMVIEVIGKMYKKDIGEIFDNLEDFKAYVNIYRMTDEHLQAMTGGSNNNCKP